VEQGHRIVIFSDLDGCLLNKEDYDFSAATTQLERIRARGIPLVLASSKTEVEMRGIADEMRLEDAPMICENGGTILWSRASTVETNRTILGVPRKRILRCLNELKTDYRFRSFEDLGVAGIAEATNLSQPKAAAAFARRSTEPLLWDDSDARLEPFRQSLLAAGLTLTRGGRFWHVAGETSKGAAMQCVLEHYQSQLPDAGIKVTTIAIGDSPIDQSMLDIADYPIAIPTPDGLVQVSIGEHNGRVSKLAGAAGWSVSVGDVLEELADEDR
jgi:mannosyl-3-phosphoglycerate phosphatase